ncbi:hypothetical protein H6F88_30670 [Oculatella sp. FACHB-28]|uniref:hypothetical protein n=1 Tax=Oculatella sp. FACHB-28 TaxID=2692845 RepID=UPI001686B185|nr:hypothetical protein [Oculatella sp. FACHB-28]MBD2060310.1 hypothetical protein [Oculatella sp. FACHB-28]
MAIHSQPASDDGENYQEAFFKKLADLPSKTRRNRTRSTHMELIATWYPHLKSAHDKGYTYDELVELISSEAGISITAGTLRKYMAKAKKEQGTASAKPAKSPSRSALLPAPQKPNPKLSPDRQARLTNRKTISDDDIESQFSNLS